MKPLFSVLIPTYNTREMSRACIQSVIEHSPGFDKTQIIVSDDGSSDGTTEMLKSFGTKLDAIITNSENIGHVKTQNHALSHAKGDYIVTLNSDCIVIPHWLERFHEAFLKNPKLGAVGAKGPPPERDRHLYDTIPSTIDSDGYANHGKRIDHVEGSRAMYLGSLIRKIGLYDPNFERAYVEDVDLSFRIRRAGYELTLIDNPIDHIGQATRDVAIKAGQSFVECERKNRVYLKKKWYRFLASHSDVKKILIVNNPNPADLLKAEPVIREMKEEYIGADVDIETPRPELFDKNPLVRGTFQPREASRENYQLVIGIDEWQKKQRVTPIVPNFEEKLRVSGSLLNGLGVVYLCWGPAGLQPALDFLKAYQDYPAKAEHDLIIAFKECDPGDVDLLSRLSPVPYTALHVPDAGFDIQAYLQLAKRINHETVCFMSTYTQPIADGWLAKLYGALSCHNVGLAGAMGSYEAMESKVWPKFPNPHIRTTGFIIRRELLNSFDFQLGNTKGDCWEFESGWKSLTRRVLGQGMRAVIVGADGGIFDVPKWRTSSTYGCPKQDNLLVIDNHVRWLNSLPKDHHDLVVRKIWGKQ